MDDYKRSLYMRARARLDSGESHYVCDALGAVLRDEGFFWPTTEDKQTLFPEFAGFYDGLRWYESGFCRHASVLDGWWEDYWKKPRLLALDTLLRD